jgi:hypothetical protein
MSFRVRRKISSDGLRFLATLRMTISRSKTSRLTVRTGDSGLKSENIHFLIFPGMTDFPATDSCHSGENRKTAAAKLFNLLTIAEKRNFRCNTLQ